MSGERGKQMKDLFEILCFIFVFMLVAFIFIPLVMLIRFIQRVWHEIKGIIEGMDR